MEKTNPGGVSQQSSVMLQVRRVADIDLAVPLIVELDLWCAAVVQSNYGPANEESVGQVSRQAFRQLGAFRRSTLRTRTPFIKPNCGRVITKAEVLEALRTKKDVLE